MNPLALPRVGLFCCLALWATVSAHSEEPYVILEDSTSPDGRFAVAWGIPYTSLDTSNMDKLLSTLDYDAVENFVVDLKNEVPVAELGTSYVPGKNHSSLTCVWRDDSAALVVVEGGKWEFRDASLIYVVDPKSEYEPCSDVIPISNAIRRAIRTQLLIDHPGEKRAIENFAISVDPLKWTGEARVQFEIVGQVPKDMDAYVFEGRKSLNLPGPTTVTTGAAAGKPGVSNAPPVGANFLISANSVGPIQLGMSVAEARKAMSGAEFKRTSDGEGVALISVVHNGKELMTMYSGEYDVDSKIENTSVIEFIEVWSSLFKTSEGISPGTKLSQAGKAYGGVRQITTSEIESREYAGFTNQPSGLYFRVENRSGSAGKYEKGAMMTTEYNPGASILTIDVSGSNINVDGSIGGIKLDLTAAELLAIAEAEEFGEVFKGKDEIWEAFGQAVQKWIFPQVGLSVDMISDEIGGPKSIFSITAKAPSRLETGKGIKMGAAKADAIEAYANFKSENDAEGWNTEQDVHVVGSIYGGMIFTFENEKVTEVFLGAAAE